MNSLYSEFARARSMESNKLQNTIEKQRQSGEARLIGQRRIPRAVPHRGHTAARSADNAERGGQRSERGQRSLRSEPAGPAEPVKPAEPAE